VQTAETARIPKTRAARSRIFDDWTHFCSEHHQAADLRGIPDSETRLCYLLVYALRRRRRTNPQTGIPIRAGTVEDALLAVGEGITLMGCQDPRKDPFNTSRNHPLLADFLHALAKEDSPQERVHPANLTILENLPNILDTEHLTDGRANLHAIDLCIIGFFWMLRPAEYLFTGHVGRSEAFRLCDVTFHVGSTALLGTDKSLNDVNVNRITRTSLTFTDQKNAVRGEQISHAATRDPLLCPCKALARICRHLRYHNAKTTTPLHIYYNYPHLEAHATPTLITNALRHSANNLRHKTGIDPRKLSARSLRPGGATALLCADIDPNIIQLLGRWKSDAMLRYLRVAATANTHNYATCMLDAGHYTMTTSPNDVLPDQAPREFLDAYAREDLYNA